MRIAVIQWSNLNSPLSPFYPPTNRYLTTSAVARAVDCCSLAICVSLLLAIGASETAACVVVVVSMDGLDGA